MSLDLESMDSFASAHQRVVDKLSELMFTPKTFNPNIDEKKQNVRDRKLSEYQVAYVRTRPINGLTYTYDISNLQ